MPITDEDDVDLDDPNSVVSDEENADDEVVDPDPDEQDDDQDDSQDDDDLGDDADDEDVEADDEGEAAPAKKQSRYQKLIARAKAAEAAKQKLEVELAAKNVTHHAPADNKAEREAEEARIAEMEPAARDAYLARKETQQTKNAVAYLNFKIEDSADLSMYAAKSVMNPLYAKYADRVEAKLAEMRKSGQNSKREVVLDFLIGNDARKRAESGSAGPKKKSAASRMDAARSKPAKGRSDAGGYKSKGKSAEERLEGVAI